MIRVCCVLVLLWLTAAPAGAQDLGSITGQVLTQEEGSPLSGARIIVTETSQEASTGGDGRFAINRVPAGDHIVAVVRDGYATLSQTVTIAASQPTVLDVRLPFAPTLAQSLTVVGRVSDYLDANAVASRTTARLLDVPQAIAVLPARLLDDIGALDTKDLYRYVSGVVDSPYSSTVMRGFTQREALVNGVRGNPYGSLDGDINNSGFSTSQFRLTNLERVEILKGPASVLYGSSEPGGVINYITRKPKDEFQATATFGTGQYRQGLAQVDVTGPANAARTLLYRGALYFEARDSFRFNANTRNTHAVGDLTWKAGPRTAVAFEYERIDQDNGAHRLRGVPVTAAGDFLADYRWTASEPSDFTNLKAHVAQIRVDHALTNGARLDSTFRYLAYDRQENYHEPRGITNGGLLMQREYRDQFRTNDDWTATVNLSKPVNMGGAGRHDLAVGADIFRQNHLYRFATARQQNAGGPVPPLALGDPIYGVTSAATYGLTPASYGTDTAVSTRSGVYAQDLMSFGARWLILLGGRLDRYDDTGQSGGLDLAADHLAPTGRAGLVFKPHPQLSLYSTVSNGFNRAAILSQTPSANGPHDPETSRQVEAGAKAEWLGGRVQFTTAVFQAVKDHVLRPDPSLGPTGTNANAILATGKVRNRGLEMDLAGSPLPWWNLALNYAYLDSTITEDVNPALIGHAMPNAAPHTVGLFTRIDLPLRAAVAASLQYVGDREEPFAGIRAPVYTVLDGHLYHEVTPRIRLALKVENLFNRRYASSSLFAARAGNIPGQPRTVSIALTLTSRPSATPATP